MGLGAGNQKVLLSTQDGLSISESSGKQKLNHITIISHSHPNLEVLWFLYLKRMVQLSST